MRSLRARVALTGLAALLAAALFSCRAEVLNGAAIESSGEERYGNEARKRYTVTFDAAGGAWTGNEDGVRVLEEGGRLVFPRAPLRDGFTLAGWYDEPLPPLDWNEEPPARGRFGSNTPVDADVTVYARWKIKPVDSYTVTFMPYEGADIAHTGFVYVQDLYTWKGPLPSPGTRTGYTPDGLWWTDPREGEPFAAGSVVTEDITVYARWTPEDYRLYYWANDGAGGIYSTNIVTYPVGEIILPIRPARADYAFVGWYTRRLDDLRHDLLHNDPPPPENGFNPQSEVAADTHVYALWKVVPPGAFIVTFSYYDNYATEAAALFEDGYTIPGDGIPETGSRPHYTCDGKWYMENGEEFDENVVLDANITVRPRWTGNTYAVRFMRNDGTDAVLKTERVTYPQNTLGSLPATPERAHYTNDGAWYLGGGEEFTGGTVITGNTDVSPRWTGNPYTARFRSNGGTDDLLYEETVRYPAAVSFKGTLPVRAHFESDGVFWTAPEGGAPAPTATVIDADTDFYLRWTKKRYTVTFNVNGGGGANTSVAAAYDERVEPPAAPAKSGSVFAGWNHAPNGMGRYFGGGCPASDFTLYAAWVPAANAPSIIEAFDKGLARTNTTMTQGGEYDDHFLVGSGAYSGPPSGAAVAAALVAKLDEAARLRQGTQKTETVAVEGGTQQITRTEYDYAAINIAYQDIEDLLADPAFERGGFAPTGHTLNYTGAAQSVTAVNGGRYEIELWGASGGHIWSRNNKTALGGKGAYVKGIVYLNKGDVLKFYVGQEGFGSAAYNTATGAFSRITNFQAEGGGASYRNGHKGGWNGGGSGGRSYQDDYAGGSGGGGATDVRYAGTYGAGINNKGNGTFGFETRLMAAGSGGGAAQSAGVGNDNWPGLAGGDAGANGIRKGNIATGGARAGGLTALDPAVYGASRTSGSKPGEGGAGAAGTGTAYEGAGGGGGGYFGGESISVIGGTDYTSSGAGGSSWHDASRVSAGPPALNPALGNGKAAIRFIGE